MKICLLGFRKGLVNELERRNLNYVVVAEKVKMRKLRGALISSKIPQDLLAVESFIRNWSSELNGVTHIIACGEGGVVAANWFRISLGLEAYPEDLILACSDKLFMKRTLSNKGIPVTDFIGGDEGLSASQIIERLGPKVVVKELNNSGGKGQLIVIDQSLLPINPSLIYESYISDAQEMSVESIIQGGKIIFTSTTEYYEKGVVNVVPARHPAKILKEVLALNQAVLSLLGVDKGMTHLEVYIKKDSILFGEVALRPPGGYIMKLIESTSGFNPWEVYLDLHLGHPVEINSTQQASAAAIILHPGAGTCQGIYGADKVKSLNSFESMRVKGKVGDTFTERIGVGQEVAHILLKNQDSQLLLKDIKKARDVFSFAILR